MFQRDGLRFFVCALIAKLAVVAPVAAEGTFDIPPGAHFNPDKLAKVSEFFKNEVATGKIPGAIVLIQQHGKPVYHEILWCAGRRLQGADHGPDDFPPVLDDQGHHQRGRGEDGR